MREALYSIHIILNRKLSDKILIENVSQPDMHLKKKIYSAKYFTYIFISAKPPEISTVQRVFFLSTFHF